MLHTTLKLNFGRLVGGHDDVISGRHCTRVHRPVLRRDTNTNQNRTLFFYSHKGMLRYCKHRFSFSVTEKSFHYFKLSWCGFRIP